jgi:hypothetical protein
MPALVIAIVVIGILVLIIFLPYIIQVFKRQQRTSLMKSVAKQMGFAFHVDYRVGCYDLGMESVTSKLSEAGISNICFSFRNILSAKRKGVKWMIFDAGYGKEKRGSARYISTYLQAEVNADYPKLVVTKVSLDAKTFAKRYRVDSAEPLGGRLLTDALKRLLMRSGLSLQCGGPLVQFHAPLAKPEAIPALFENARALLEELSHSTASTTARSGM